ncbi:putative site-specific integrase/resolvase [Paenibacillus alvei DSM 29]|uniref:recombinase family protein n=1 Tax=Paenibacillus alvei TaxID=44250 RepID=UPI0002897A95|nr:putative site-specific integrase/resolvase [Paenibacillus alvei DSM 29]
MRVGKYRRVSTDMQREEGISLHTQDERLNSFVHSQGWTVVADYSDEGFSAKDMNRPALQKLISDMQQKNRCASCISFRQIGTIRVGFTRIAKDHGSK